MTQGIIYYNKGTSCLVRILVSVSSLRKVYSGPITILSEGIESTQICKKICEYCKADLKEVKLNIQDKSSQYLTKPYLNECTPYDITIHIDADTLILKDPSCLFNKTIAHDFIVPQFTNWTTEQNVVRRRIKNWLPICPDYVKYLLENKMPAVNCGIFGWSNHSTIFNEWRSLLAMGKNKFIPDEISLQLIIPYYPHEIISHDFNCSCKFDKVSASTHIVHYHGRKHCRAGLPFNGKLWIDEFIRLQNENAAIVRDWYLLDRRLVKFLEKK